MRFNLPKAKRPTVRAAAWLALAFFLLSGFRCEAQAREVHVLAAADLQPVMPILAGAFEHATGIKLIVSFGSSSTLATQILNGDSADLFLAADYSFPEKIVAGGLADSPAPIAYARGTLVLFARKDSPFQPLNQNTLRDPEFSPSPSPTSCTPPTAAPPLPLSTA